MSETDSAPSPETTTTTAAAPLPAEAVGGLTSEERTWGMLAHLTALAGLIGIPFGNILGPLIIWLIKKDTMPFVNEQGKEALNFQITVTLAIIACVPLILLLIGFFLMFVVGIAALVLTIIAAVKANSGESYRYPLTIRLIK